MGHLTREHCLPNRTEAICVAGFYQFVALDELGDKRQWLKDLGHKLDLRGTVLLAPEGLNGTIAGASEQVAKFVDCLRGWAGLADLNVRLSGAPTMPFQRLKIRLKREIVTFGQPGSDPLVSVGRYIEPGEWDELIADPNTVVIDTRNDYETAIGTFAGAIDPKLQEFGDFPQWWAEHGQQFAGKTVAMFCTGGIRCEKATSWLRQQGVDDVAHLKGGILAYLNDRAEDHSNWSGGCFVFDERVALGHGLAPAPYRLCRPCGYAAHQDDEACAHCGRPLLPFTTDAD